MSAGATRAAEKGDPARVVQKIGERANTCGLRDDHGLLWKKVDRLWRGCVDRRLKRDIARNDDHGHAALPDRFTNRDLQDAGHLFRAGDNLTIMTALFE